MSTLPPDPQAEIARLRRRATVWTWVAVAGVVLTAWSWLGRPSPSIPSTKSTSSTPGRLSWPPASYVKDVVCLPEGYGVYTYFTLAAADGTPTASDGVAIVTYGDTRFDYSGDQYYEILRRDTFPVRSSAFETATLGLGAMAHQGLIYRVGRVSLDELKGLRQSSTLGKVSVRFIPEPGCTLYAATTVSWPD